MLTQTWALIIAAYRELNAKKLFWITLLLSGMVVVASALLGINEEGVSIAGGTLKNRFLNTDFISEAEFYKMIFIGVAIPYWLAGPAIILALISTAGTTPDFITGGTIDGYLSKPISRSRLFLTKYFLSLLFVAVQVLLFSAGWFLLIGLRAGDWSPSIFFAVPLVVLLFSYLYCVCVLIGLLTRSTMASLLLTLLLWLGLWAGNWTDLYLLGQREGAALDVADRLVEIDAAQHDEDDARATELQSLLEDDRQSLRSATLIYSAATVVRTILPKTSETTNLLERYTLTIENEDELVQQQRDRARSQDNEIPDWLRMGDPRVAERIGERRTERSVLWIIGSSLGFEVLILGLATLIFVRRDF